MAILQVNRLLTFLRGAKLERRETSRYLEMFYSLKYRNLVSGVDILDLRICRYHGHSYLFRFGKAGKI